MSSDFFRTSDKKWRIGIIDGPNMSSLGRRDPDMYGTISSWEELRDYTQQAAAALNIEVVNFVSNHEGHLLEWIHANSDAVDGWLINPAGLTTNGEATRHALAESRRPYIETHFANTAKFFARVSGAQRLESRFTITAQGLVMGFRQYSYVGALVALTMALDDETFEV